MKSKLVLDKGEVRPTLYVAKRGGNGGVIEALPVDLDDLMLFIPASTDKKECFELAVTALLTLLDDVRASRTLEKLGAICGPAWDIAKGLLDEYAAGMVALGINPADYPLVLEPGQTRRPLYTYDVATDEVRPITPADIENCSPIGFTPVGLMETLVLSALTIYDLAPEERRIPSIERLERVLERVKAQENHEQT